MSTTTSSRISPGMNLRDSSRGLPMSLRELDAGAETAAARGGQKCSYQTAPPSSDPLRGLTESGQTLTTPAPRAPPDSSGIWDRDPTRSTAGRRISTILRFALSLSGPGIQVFPVWFRCPLSSMFWYCFCSRLRVMWAVTSEFGRKWIANSGHDKSENLNSDWLWQKNPTNEGNLCYWRVC